MSPLHPVHAGSPQSHARLATVAYCGDPVHVKLSRADRCRLWNADVDHQRAAGRARACGFTSEHQSKAAHASFSAFSARYRAAQGLAPLHAADCRYLTPDCIRAYAYPIPRILAALILDAWSAGDLRGVPDFVHESAVSHGF